MTPSIHTTRGLAATLSRFSFCVLLFTVAGCDGSTEPYVAAEPDEPVRVPGKGDGGDLSRPGALDWYNSADRISEDFERRYDALPMAGKTSKVPWTDSYWPRQDGGISFRWQVGEKHTYTSPTREELQAMPLQEVANLSPSEKYDILLGNYMYPLTIRVLAGNKPTESAWTGYCHGWTAASIHFEEPQPVTVTNPDGIQVPFGSSDVKALLTYFQGEVVRSRLTLPFLAPMGVAGSVCGSSNPADPSCYDANPGMFHTVLANQVGLRDEAFGIDADNTYEKWNQPVHTYESHELMRREPGAGAHADAVEEVVVQSLVTYTMEIHPAWDAVGGTERHTDTTKTYTYTLELDVNGEIVGGQWAIILEDGRPMTLHEVHEYFLNRDEDGDGRLDLTPEQAQDGVWHYFDFPDYVWVQEKGTFSETFRSPQSNMEILVNTSTTRALLYDYFAGLSDLYEAGIR